MGTWKEQISQSVFVPVFFQFCFHKSAEAKLNTVHARHEYQNKTGNPAKTESEGDVMDC